MYFYSTPLPVDLPQSHPCSSIDPLPEKEYKDENNKKKIKEKLALNIEMPFLKKRVFAALGKTLSLTKLTSCLINCHKPWSLINLVLINSPE